MKKKKFTVHKYIVQNNRMGFELWASQNNKSHIYDSISKEWVNLDDFSGDRIPLELVSNEYKKIAKLADEPNLGLKVVKNYIVNPSPFTQILKLALNPILSRNIELPKILVLRLICRYYGIITEVVSMECYEFNQHILINFKPNIPELISEHQIEGIMFGFTRLVNNLLQKWPNQVQFTHIPEKIDLELYKSTFNNEPLFTQEQNQLSYYFSEDIYDINYPLLINLIIHALKKQFPEMPFIEMIKILLQATLGFISPSRKNIADAFSISVKTLQRRLNYDGVTFNELLLEVRKNRVHDYLSYRQFTLEQISLLLGYKAKSQFLKAFRSWFGITPKEYRAKMNSAL